MNKIQSLGLVLVLLITGRSKAAEPEFYSVVNREMHGEVTVQGFGSGFAVTETRLLTCAHMVEDRKHALPTYVVIDGKEHLLRVLKLNREMDLALCEVESKILKPVVLGEDVNDGFVMFNGYPRNKRTSALGTILERYYRGWAKDLAEVAFDHGMSGGLVSVDSKCVGMAIAGIPVDGDMKKTVGLFYPVSVIKWFLRDAK